MPNMTVPMHATDDERRSQDNTPRARIETKSKTYILPRIALALLAAFLVLNANHYSTRVTSIMKQRKTSSITEANVNPPFQIDVIQHLKGQMGNIIHSLAAGYLLKRLSAEYELPVDIRLHYSAKNDQPRLVESQRDVQKCFPEFAKADFTEFNGPWREKVKNTQFGIYKQDASIFVNSESSQEMIIGALQDRIQLIMNERSSESGLLQKFKTTIGPPLKWIPIELPYLFLDGFSPMSLIDRYYQELTELMRYDFEKCCKALPLPDETVLHIRGFSDELGHTSHKQGFDDLDPLRTANELLGHLTPGSKVAIVSPTRAISLPYLNSLQKRGIEVRLVNQNRIQDFCFLMNAKKELVGNHLSTYTFWSSVLSPSVERVVLYSIKNEENQVPNHTFDGWTNPRLKNLFSFPVFEQNSVIS